MRKPLVRAVLDGASQIAVPTFVATLSICIVFVPVLLLTGTANICLLRWPWLLCSRCGFLSAVAHAGPDDDGLFAGAELDLYRRPHGAGTNRRRSLLRRVHHRVRCPFEKLRFRYMGLLDWALRHRGRFLIAFSSFCVLSLGLIALVGEDFFPNVDSGQMRLHARAPAGTRIEETEVRFAALEQEIRSVIPAQRDRHAD